MGQILIEKNVTWRGLRKKMGGLVGPPSSRGEPPNPLRAAQNLNQNQETFFCLTSTRAGRRATVIHREYITTPE